MEGGDASQDKSMINTIMLRFRPIAPKPVPPAGSSSAPGDLQSQTRKNAVVLGKKKRRYARVSKKNNRPKPHGTVSEERESAGSEAPEGETSRRKAPETSVTVECVTGTCMEGGGGIGCTDVERWMNLEKDTCPAFISDSGYTVKWTNEAYRRTVTGGGDGGEVSVRLVVKEGILPVTWPAFACIVSLQYTCQKEKWSTKTVPCDVWRMDDGGFAWRLDFKAALSLSL